jgi:hypothetical protein
MRNATKIQETKKIVKSKMIWWKIDLVKSFPFFVLVVGFKF